MATAKMATIQKTSILLLAVILSLAVIVTRAHELPPLGKMLELAGLGEEGKDGEFAPLTPEQLKIVDEMSQVYEAEDDLHDRERALLHKVGLRRPDGVEKGKLLVMYNNHLLASRRLGELARQLRASVAAQKEQQGQQEPAQAA